MIKIRGKKSFCVRWRVASHPILSSWKAATCTQDVCGALKRGLQTLVAVQKHRDFPFRGNLNKIIRETYLKLMVYGWPPSSPQHSAKHIQFFRSGPSSDAAADRPFTEGQKYSHRVFIQWRPFEGTDGLSAKRWRTQCKHGMQAGRSD